MLDVEYKIVRCIKEHINPKPSKKNKFENISDFYKKTLPQLGWKFVSNKENALHFERDMEVLDIVLEKNKPLLVRVTLKSKD